MSRRTLNDWFGFTRAQIRGLALLTAIAIGLAVYNGVRLLTVPTPDQPPLPVLIGNERPAPLVGTFRIDPNTAPADSLELLPGIGRVVADAIVAARDTLPFARIPDLVRVRGIGPATLDRITPYLILHR